MERWLLRHRRCYHGKLRSSFFRYVEGGRNEPYKRDPLRLWYIRRSLLRCDLSDVHPRHQSRSPYGSLSVEVGVRDPPSVEPTGRVLSEVDSGSMWGESDAGGLSGVHSRRVGSGGR